jgi:hypothetical protein
MRPWDKSFTGRIEEISSNTYSSPQRGRSKQLFLGCTIRKKRGILRNRQGRAPLAIAKRPRGGSRTASEKRASGADVKQIIAKLSPVLRLGELLPKPNIVTRVPEDGQLRLPAFGPVVVSAGRTANDAANSMDSQKIHGMGLRGTVRRIIVEPCAGKPHARFERGLLKTAGYHSQYRVKIYP